MTRPAEDTIAVRIAKALAERIIAGTIEPGARLRQDHIANELLVARDGAEAVAIE